MPHSTSPGLPQRERSSSRAPLHKQLYEARTSMEKFPDLDSFVGQSEDQSPHGTNGHSFVPPPPRWQSRRDPGHSWLDGSVSTGKRGHGRQKSLSDAFRTIRTRKGSVSANAHEIADALKAPVDAKLIILCVIWYFSSALTNTSSKSILNAFPKPATLTLIQFLFVAGYCLLFSWLANTFPAMKSAIPALRHGIRPPSRDVIITTLPLAAFQIGGHLLSSTATSKIPVSLVHTIKGLSPLFTVFAYRLIFDIRYPIATYLSLIPLTLGVMLACSASFKGNIIGILCAFLAALIFVTQNIFSKRLFNEAAKAEAEGMHVHSKKLDKLNLLCYCSSLAFILTLPIWAWSEGFALLGDFMHDGAVDLTSKPNTFDHGRLFVEFIFNGTFHFGQNIIAFVLLSMVSPVTYSVASLIKRVFVVVIAIIWFQNSTTPMQGLGIALTFFGLYLYDRTSESNKADKRAQLMDIKEEPLLPTLNTRVDAVKSYASPGARSGANPFAASNGSNGAVDEKATMEAGVSRGRTRGASAAVWLPPGTKAEETWRAGEGAGGLQGRVVAMGHNLP